MKFDNSNPTEETSRGSSPSFPLAVKNDFHIAARASRSELTSSFMAGEQHQVVSHSGGVVGQRELQLELVEEAEAGDGGEGHKGRVTKLVAAAESGTGYVDGCRRREETHLFPRAC